MKCPGRAVKVDVCGDDYDTGRLAAGRGWVK
jgi:hypothetical protein